ncbi:hypothetical protein A2V71_02125 [Candidatus Berkelbacteria bacterium RBG_13_40_8]|uniref:Uncharacterized protein n=1 Tax=Candidatus Berkelbacteria bacterium RBG_13_40_8 TaxID=1797467 RepID=A0A1F5DQ65_9BACT|nr:MAG: hypothetical protein A2V71_02125 [Candidatus Berkelbacteria bacterium RBG_13_40_8]
MEAHKKRKFAGELRLKLLEFGELLEKEQTKIMLKNAKYQHFPRTPLYSGPISERLKATARRLEEEENR